MSKTYFVVYVYNDQLKYSLIEQQPKIELY